MKVKELIEKLKSCDPELMVVVNGYEGGVNEAENAAQVKIKLDKNPEWYYGTHEDAASELAVDKETVKGVVLL